MYTHSISEGTPLPQAPPRRAAEGAAVAVAAEAAAKAAAAREQLAAAPIDVDNAVSVRANAEAKLSAWSARNEQRKANLALLRSAPDDQDGVETSEQVLAMHAADQKALRVYTRWWRTQLAGLGVPVRVLHRDVRTGVLPCQLLEVLTGRPLPHRREPKNRYHSLENLTAFLKAVKAEGIKVVNISAEDLVDGSNPKPILSLTQQLISRFAFERHARDSLRRRAARCPPSRHRPCIRRLQCDPMPHPDQP